MPTIAEPDGAALADAAERVRAGDVVAFPTETVYGLGADAFSPAALDRLFELKGRPFDNPLIAHVLTPEAARELVAVWPRSAQLVTARFWPGPLTIVLPKAPRVAPRLTGGRPTVAVRSPRHAVARELLERFGSAIAAPSANRSGRVSPTTARHVAEDFADVADLLILDGGPCEVGLESTVVDLSDEVPRILRPGCVTLPELRDVLGEVVDRMVLAQEASPGTSLRHYAPRLPARLVATEDLREALGEELRRAIVLTFDARCVQRPHRAIEMPQGAGEYGRRLYAALREAERLGGDVIVIEEPPASNETWRAVLDRLRRATA